MQRLVTYGSLCALLLAASEARPCGGAFGPNGATVSIDPVQQIVVSYRNSIETYVFNPYFCGQSDSFGLILPVPAMLTQNPALEQAQLYKDLATVTAPTYVDQTQCYSTTGGSASRGTGGAGSLSNGGATVIQRGQVGIFDWALLQATSTTAFTDWLTANGFPYQGSAQTAFSSYVSSGWYFVAFKVSAAGASGVGGAGSTTPTSTSSTKICGNFGPIALAFPSATQPVVPARIAAVSSNQLTWTLFTLASQQLKLRDYPSTLRFSGPVGDSEMSTYPSLAAVAQSGDRLTELQMSFSSVNVNDILLVPDPAQADYRREETRIVYVSCTGGAPTTGGSSAIHAGGTSGAGGVSTGGISTVKCWQRLDGRRHNGPVKRWRRLNGRRHNGPVKRWRRLNGRRPDKCVRAHGRLQCASGFIGLRAAGRYGWCVGVVIGGAPEHTRGQRLLDNRPAHASPIPGRSGNSRSLGTLCSTPKAALGS